MGSFPKQPISGFSVGISGHRWNRMSSDAAPRIARQLTSVFAEIDDTIRHEAKDESGDPPNLRLVSSLAEGADQLAVSSRPAAWSLSAILPFPRARYENDFAPGNAGGVDRRPDFRAALAQAASIVEVPEEGDAVLAYERAGELLLQESDLLVTVWDGLPGSGRGGTQAVISRAIALALPVIWIRSDREEVPAVLPASIQADRPAKACLSGFDSIRSIVASIVRGK